MTDIPKKLDIMDLLDLKEEYLFEQLFYKVNELRDYLSDKEASKGEYPFQHDFEPDKNGKCWCNIPKESGYHTNPPQQEECKVCKGTGDMGGDNCKACFGTGLPYLRNPKQEESRGECEQPFCWGCGVDKDAFIHDINCPKKYPKTGTIKPQLKEESPKEDEQEWTHDFYELMQSYRHTPITDQIGTSRAYELVKDHINSRYVSKEKIKKVAKEVMEGRASTLMGILLESLGLEEL